MPNEEYHRVSLQEYLERVIEERYERVDAVMIAHRHEHEMLQLAIDKFEESLQQRLVNRELLLEEIRKRMDHFVVVQVVETKESSLSERISDLRNSITPGLGPRVTALEIDRANLAGRFWALSAIIVILTLVLQFWPLLKPH